VEAGALGAEPEHVTADDRISDARDPRDEHRRGVGWLQAEHALHVESRDASGSRIPREREREHVAAQHEEDVDGARPVDEQAQRTDQPVGEERRRELHVVERVEGDDHDRRSSAQAVERVDAVHRIDLRLLH
jgi:hypothetical protein